MNSFVKRTEKGEIFSEVEGYLNWRIYGIRKSPNNYKQNKAQIFKRDSLNMFLKKDNPK